MSYKFNDLKKEYDQLKTEKDKRRHKNANDIFQRDAKELYASAICAKSKEEAYELAMKAYELDSYSYEYKTFAISKMADKYLKCDEYLGLIDKIERMSDKDNLLKIYDEDELYSERFKDLSYKYIMSLLDIEFFDEALFRIDEYNENFFSFFSKLKHIRLNILLMQKRYDEVIDEYYEETEEDICILIPVSFAYIKLKQYKEGFVILSRIKNINKFAFEFLLNYIDNKELDKATSAYHVSSKEEVYFAYKYFVKTYLNDKEYLNIINNYAKLNNKD